VRSGECPQSRTQASFGLKPAHTNPSQNPLPQYGCTFTPNHRSPDLSDSASRLYAKKYGGRGVQSKLLILGPSGKAADTGCVQRGGQTGGDGRDDRRGQADELGDGIVGVQ
jgi:hypothetical protein